MFHWHFSFIFLFHCKTTRNKNKQRQMIFEHLKLDFVVCFEVILRFICVPIALYISYVAFLCRFCPVRFASWILQCYFCDLLQTRDQCKIVHWKKGFYYSNMIWKCPRLNYFYSPWSLRLQKFIISVHLRQVVVGCIALHYIEDLTLSGVLRITLQWTFYVRW